jgi:hypothetical protein
MGRADETARSEIQQYAESREARLHQLENAVQFEVDQATSDLQKQTAQRAQAFQEQLISRLDDIELLTGAVLQVEIE